MNRKYIWLISCVSAVLISFLLPWIVLGIMEYGEKKEITRVDDSGELQDYGSLSIAQKQIMLSSAGLSISEDRTINQQDRERISRAFREELQQLLEDGALPMSMQLPFSEELHIQTKLALLAEDGRAFRYCEISNEAETATAVFDIEQHMILRIMFRAQSDQYQIDLGASSDDALEECLVEEIRSWANYYGCSAQDIEVFIDAESSVRQVSVVGCILSDGTDQFRFGLIYDLDYDILCWGSSLETTDASEMR